jgi:hypothetical protein
MQINNFLSHVAIIRSQTFKVYLKTKYFIEMHIKNIILFCIILCFPSEAFSQKNDFFIKKLINKVFSEKADSSRKSSFMALPALSYAQETEYLQAGGKQPLEKYI